MRYAPGSTTWLETADVRAHSGLLRRAHLCAPADFTTVAVEEARHLGADELVIYLADDEERTLVPVPGRHTADRAPLSIDGTLGGRAYSTTSVLEVEHGSPAQTRLWIPLLDGTQRLGVVELGLRPAIGEVPEALVEACERYVHLLAQVSLSKAAYGDIVEFVRRTRRLSVAAELQRAQLPPPTFATERLVVAAFLEPAAGGGGDGYDYAADGDTAHLAVFDSPGGGTAAAATTALALAAYRNSRRALLGLEETWAVVDTALAQAGPATASALLAELDLGTGAVRWVSAAHGPPLLLRGGHLVRAPEARPAPPLGRGSGSAPSVGRRAMEPGDRLLLLSDGVEGSRLPGGAVLAQERLAESVERHGAARGAAEAVRRLRHAVVGRGALHDDATVLLVQWQGGSERKVLTSLVRRAVR